MLRGDASPLPLGHRIWLLPDLSGHLRIGWPDPKYVLNLSHGTLIGWILYPVKWYNASSDRRINPACNARHGEPWQTPEHPFRVSGGVHRARQKSTRRFPAEPCRDC